MDTPQILEAHLQWLHPRRSSSSKLSLTITWIPCRFHIAVTRPGFNPSDHKMKRVDPQHPTAPLNSSKVFSSRDATPQCCRQRQTPELRATVKVTIWYRPGTHQNCNFGAQTSRMGRGIYGGWRSGAKLMSQISCRHRFDNVALGRLQSFFQVDQQVDISLYLISWRPPP